MSPIAGTVSALLRSAADAYKQGDFAAAETFARAVLDRRPAEAEAYHILGLVALAVERPAEAVALIRAGLSIRPRHPTMPESLTLALLAAGAHTAAIAVCREAIAMSPEMATRWRHLADALNRAEDRPGFRRAVKVLRRLDPAGTDLEMNEFAADLDAGRPDLAEPVIRRVKERNIAQRLEGRRIALTDRVASQPPMTAGGDDWIFGQAIGYRPDQLRIYVESLRRSGFAGRTVFFVGREAPETVAYLRDADIRLVLTDDLDDLAIDLQLARWSSFLTFLDQMELDGFPDGRPGRIFTGDVRDLLFQADPFQGLPDATAVFVQEAERNTIGSCSFNANWFRRSLGQAGLDAVADKKISCGGTSYFTYDALRLHCVLINELTLPIPPAARRLPGIDQVHHNVIVHRGLVPGAILLPNRTVVDTVGQIDPSLMTMTDDGWMAPIGRPPCPVLHQYDRHAHLAAHFDRLFAPATR